VSLCLAAGCVLPAGCGLGRQLREAFGLTERVDYLLYGFDVLAVPNEPVEVQARLQEGPYLRDEDEVWLVFRHEKRTVARARTDDEGIARGTFTPPGVGDYLLHVEVPDGQVEGVPPAPAGLLVAVRRPEESIVVIDVDKTLVASDFATVVEGDARPMPDSVRVVRRLSEAHTIVYLTLRPDHFGPKTKTWLRTTGYPTGPVWVSRFGELFDGNREYRRRHIERLRRRFPNVRVGIGDKISDVEAYRATGLTAVLVVRPPQEDEADDCREEADELAELSEEVQVVRSWAEIEAVLFEGATFPPDRMVKILRERAAALERSDARP